MKLRTKFFFFRLFFFFLFFTFVFELFSCCFASMEVGYYYYKWGFLLFFFFPFILGSFFFVFLFVYSGIRSFTDVCCFNDCNLVGSCLNSCFWDVGFFLLGIYFFNGVV